VASGARETALRHRILGHSGGATKEGAMKHVATLLGLLVLTSACGSNAGRFPTNPSGQPSPSPQPSPAPPAIAPIALGEQVTGTLTAHGTKKAFELTSPSSGTLVVQLTWDRKQGLPELLIADRQFSGLDGSPIVGRLAVVAGHKYVVTVADGAPWDYDDLFLPFAFTTAIQ
jgi:hypothetical protein